MTKEKKWNILFVLLASVAMLVAFFLLMPTNKIEKKIDFDSVYLYEGSSDNIISMIAFKKEAGEEEETEELKAYYTIIESVKDVYLYKIIERELNSEVVFDENHIELEFFVDYEGTFSEDEKELIFDDGSQDVMVFQKGSIKDWEEMLEHFRGRIGLLNTSLEEEDEDALAHSEELREEENDLNALYDEIIQDMEIVRAATEGYTAEFDALSPIIEGTTAGVSYTSGCEDEEYDFYCELKEIKEGLEVDYKEADILSEELFIRIEQGDEALHHYLEELDEKSYSSRVSYGEDYFKSLEKEGEEIVKAYEEAKDKFNRMVRDFEEKYVN